MSEFPNKDDFFAPGAQSVGPTRTAQRVFYDAVRQLPGARARAALVLAADAATPTQGTHTIDTEGAAASDDLKWLLQANLPDGALLSIRSADNARDVVVKHAAGGAGQIILADGADFTLADTTMGLFLERVGTTWVEVDRSYGGNKAAAFANIKQAATDTLSGVVEKSTSAENLAGVAVDKFPDVAGVKEMIDALGNSTALSTDVRMISLLLAQLMNATVYLFDGWADNFSDQTGVETALNVGATYVATGGGYYHNPSSQPRITTGTPTAPKGGTAANFNDNNTGTECTTGALGMLGGQPESARVIAQLDFGSNKQVIKAEMINYRLSESSSGMQLMYSTDGANYTQLSSGTLTTSNQTLSWTGAAVTARYIAAVVGASNFDYITATVADLNAYETNPAPNMTVVSKAVVPSASAPTVGKLLVQIKDITGGAVVNTDFEGYISRDNGTTWTKGTFVFVQTLADGTKEYEFTSLDISAQPSGTSVRCKFATLNNKEIQLHGWVVGNK